MKVQTKVIWVSAIILVGIASFFSGKTLYYKDGYRDGVIFADSSSYKRGKTEGYKEGYEYCDSIAEDLDRLRTSEMFNLNIIFEELADPKAYIKASGTIETREGSPARSSKYVKVRITNSASFARYNDLVMIARFKDKREGVIGDFEIKSPYVLYPRKSLNFEIEQKDVPEHAESVDILIESAQGLD
jgi:hypothetical protein